jgi:hypothetical protein
MSSNQPPGWNESARITPAYKPSTAPEAEPAAPGENSPPPSRRRLAVLVSAPVVAALLIGGGCAGYVLADRSSSTAASGGPQGRLGADLERLVRLGGTLAVPGRTRPRRGRRRAANPPYRHRKDLHHRLKAVLPGREAASFRARASVVYSTVM